MAVTRHEVSQSGFQGRDELTKHLQLKRHHEQAGSVDGVARVVGGVRGGHVAHHQRVALYLQLQGRGGNVVRSRNKLAETIALTSDLIQFCYPAAMNNAERFQAHSAFRENNTDSPY